METRANHVWVGAITLLLLAGLAIFIITLARLGADEQRQYDIFFKTSVDGLARGSQVTFSGVPVGQVTDIELWPQDPEFVRVRVRIEDGVPILVGTTATVLGSFTGVSTVQLDGAVKNAPDISCETTTCPEDVPVIPPRPGGLGELLANAPLLLERVATLTERLTMLLSDDNQASIAGILRNTQRLTDSIADQSPEIKETLDALQAATSQGTETLAAFEDLLRASESALGSASAEAPAIAADLRATLQAARGATEELERTLGSVQPAARRVNEQTLPAAEATLRDLQRTSEALRAITERLEEDGATSLIGNQPLPDYDPD